MPKLGQKSKNRKSHNIIDEYRDVAAINSGMLNETPELKAFLKSIGVDPKAMPKDALKRFAGHLLAETERMQASEEIVPKETPETNGKIKNGLTTIRLSDVPDEEPAWLWQHRIPLDQVTMVVGDPEAGKSWCVLDICARITTGRSMPDGSPNPFDGRKRNVLWFTSDERAKKIRRRFRTQKGDPQRLEVVTEFHEKGKKQAFGLDRHLAWLEEYLDDNTLAKVVVFDPLGVFTGNVNTHQYAEVYQMMAPVNDLMEKYETTMLPIMHLNKGEGTNAKYRTNGSLAFTAGPRAVWLVQVDPNDDNRRFLLEVKNNDREVDKVGFAFQLIKPNGGLQWEEGHVDISADESLTRDESTSKAPALADAKSRLTLFLEENGRCVPSADVMAWAKSEGLCRATLMTAKSHLEVKSVKTGGSGASWCWQLPGSKSPTTPLTPRTLDSLDPLDSLKNKGKNGSKRKKQNSKNLKSPKGLRN